MGSEMIQGYASLQRRIAAIKGPVLGKSIMQTLADATHNEAANFAPHRTGNLRNTIHVGVVTETSAEVVASANYALYVEENTRPHLITPNAKKALAFASQGVINERFGVQKKSSFRLSGSLTSAAMRSFGNAAFVVVKSVHHPGTTGQHFMKRGAEAAIKSAGLLDRVVIAWNEAG